MLRNSRAFRNRQLSSPRSSSLSLKIDLHLHNKWRIVARKRFVPAIIVFHVVLSSVKVLTLISSAAEEDSRDWTVNTKTEARNFFSLFSGNNLNSRRDDEKLFPRLVLESAAYYYQVQKGLHGFLSTFLSFFSFDDFYRFDYRGRRGEERWNRVAWEVLQKVTKIARGRRIPSTFSH